MPTHFELHDAKNLLNMHRGNRVLAVTMSYDEWKRATELGPLHPRSKELEAIDRALKEYHQMSKTEASFVKLKTAFENWIRAQQRSGKAWTASERNRKGAVSKLHEQITLVEAGRSVKLMGDSEDWEARKALVEAEREAMSRLFLGRTLIFKRAPWKTQFDAAMNTGVLPVASIGSATRKLVMDAHKIMTPQTVGHAITNLCGGTTPDALFNLLGTNFSTFCTAASSILGAAAAPAKLLADLAKLGMKVNDRVGVNRERYMFRAGEADAALDCVVRLIDRELQLLAFDMGKQAANIVAGAFQAGPIASAAGAVADIIVNIRLYQRMAEEMRQGNQLLSTRQFSLDLFNVSPVLGCYFIILADTSVWINYSVHDIGTPGWMDTVEKMRKRAEPVRDLARGFIRSTKYALSGTEHMNGLEWEATWRNNKLEFLTQQADLDRLAHNASRLGHKIHDKVTGAKR